MKNLNEVTIFDSLHKGRDYQQFWVSELAFFECSSPSMGLSEDLIIFIQIKD